MVLAFDLTVLVFFTIVVNIRTALDLRGGEVPASELAAWAFGRLWAVLIMDFFIWLAITIGTVMTFQATGVEMFLEGAVLLFLAAPLIFCDVVASVEPHERWWAIVPVSIRRSIALAYAHGTLVRALAIVIFQAAFAIMGTLVEQGLAAGHVRGAEFWGNQPLNALLTPFFAALTTVVYVDALTRESESESEGG